MNDDELVKALRCGNTLGGWCYSRDCKHRENGLCELNEGKVRNDAATRIEQLAAEVDTLQSALAASQRREQAAVECIHKIDIFNNALESYTVDEAIKEYHGHVAEEGGSHE